MDLLAELECMVANVSIDAEETTSSADIARWQRLFGFSTQEAQQRIESFRSDLGRRTTISHESWSILAPEQESLGFDKESFEFSLTYGHTNPPLRSRSVDDGRGTYIMKLEGPLASIQSVRSVLGTRDLPALLLASNEDEDDEKQATFCKVSSSERHILLEYIIRNSPSFRPTFVRLAKAAKDLGTYTKAPFLGLDIEHLLPHLRPSSEIAQSPGQEEYPVWYFFYGELADPKILRSLLALEDDPDLIAAKVQGGKIKTWGRRYNAIVNASKDAFAAGWAFQVTSREQEEVLQFFETDMYEVVRCSITMDGGSVVVDGLVFRFCGPEKQLS